MRCLLTASVLALSLAGLAWSTPIETSVDTSQSTVTVQLCMLGKCDSDSSPVVGSAEVKVDPVTSPASLTLYDFDFALTQSIDLYLSWTFPSGHISATGQNISMHFPLGQPPVPPTAVTGGSFVYAGVPSDNEGTVAYTAVGMPCTLLTAAGRPCSDAIDLAEQGTTTGDMNGTVTVSPARLLRLTLNPTYSGPIDPNYPSLGTMAISGTVVCTATIPRRGDANLDGVINGKDIQGFVAVWLAPEASSWQQRFAVDMNDDDIFDLADVQLFVECLLNGGC
ncbi:MAG TPA: hypothetical protein VMV94_09035 [Phycisphaerae bacterium]|nr:hypothetical protein [Phycisphaerae bacterium]